jgi:hypothetical protein
MQKFVVLLAVAFVSGCASKPADLIVGKWIQTDATNSILEISKDTILEFSKDGVVYVIVKDDIHKIGKYKWIDDKTIEIEPEPSTQQLPDNKKDVADLKVKTIEQAVEAYKIINGEYPTDLQVLTQPGRDGSAAMLRADDLLDPWGQPIIYEPQNVDPRTRKPRIYSKGPSGPTSAIRRFKVTVTKEDLTLINKDNQETRFRRAK